MSATRVPAAQLVRSDVIAHPHIVGARLKVIDVHRSAQHVRLTVVQLRRLRTRMQTLSLRPDESVTLLERDAIPQPPEHA